MSDQKLPAAVRDAIEQVKVLEAALRENDALKAENADLRNINTALGAENDSLHAQVKTLSEDRDDYFARYHGMGAQLEPFCRTMMGMLRAFRDHDSSNPDVPPGQPEPFGAKVPSIVKRGPDPAHVTKDKLLKAIGGK